MAQTYYGLSAGLALENLKRMGLDAFDFVEYERVPSGSIVVIYDQNGVIDTSILKALISNACRIKYIYEEGGEAVESFLISQNVFDIYSDVSEGSLDSEFVMDVIETVRTKTEQQTQTTVFTDLNSFNFCTQLLSDFIRAIDDKDLNKLTEMFEKDFSRILQFPELLQIETQDKEKMRREILSMRNELKTAKDEVVKVNNLKQSIIESGSKLQADNKTLADNLVAMSAALKERDEEIKSLHESASESSIQYQSLKKDFEKTKKDLEQSTTDYNQLKLRQDGLLKQVDSLQDRLKSASYSTDSLTITLTNTFNVSKILYVKALDFMPYLVFSLAQYHRYLKNKLGNCSLVFIFPKNSFTQKKYTSKYVKLDESTKVETNTIYYMEDYSLAIEHLIKETPDSNIMIVDLTFRDSILIKSIRAKFVYAVNNKQTIEDEGLNPLDCISYADLSDQGVNAVIPHMEKNILGVPSKIITALRMSLFVNADRWWV